jgi:hypothetical protein
MYIFEKLNLKVLDISTHETPSIMSGNHNSILSLPAALQIQIFSYLNPIHSMCLGLSSKQLYTVHCSLHKSIPLNAFTYECPIPSTGLSTLCHLYTHLHDWKPAHLKYCGGCQKFCSTSSHPLDNSRGRCAKCLAKDELGAYRRDWKHLKEPTLPAPEDFSLFLSVFGIRRFEQPFEARPTLPPALAFPASE